MKNGHLVPKDFFQALPFWGELEREEQTTVKTETEHLAAAHAGQVTLRIEMGEHLTNLQGVLEPKRLFQKYLASLKFTPRTAYRYIGAYKAVKERVPDYALRLAAARGIDLVGYQESRPFGPYTEPIAQLPPPKDPDKVGEWLDRLEEKKKALPRKSSGRSPSPDASLKQAYRSVTAAFKRLPSGKGRVAWSKRLLGLLMTEFGLPAQTIEPEAVPEGFQAVVGRPRKSVQP